eukprot:182705-Chlamydomonas_euryale.AAC.9
MPIPTSRERIRQLESANSKRDKQLELARRSQSAPSHEQVQSLKLQVSQTGAGADPWQSWAGKAVVLPQGWIKGRLHQRPKGRRSSHTMILNQRHRAGRKPWG